MASLAIFHETPWLFAGIVLFWGLSLGSFTTCVLYRVPRGLSLWRDTDGSLQSFCPNCHTHLTLLDLVPVFSWLALRGHCRHCAAPIGKTYLLVELAVLSVTGGLAVIFGFSAAFFLSSALIPVVIGVAALGYKKRAS